MSVIDNLIRGMKFNSDDSDYNDEYEGYEEEGYDDYEDNRSSRRVVPFRNTNRQQADDSYSPATLTGNAIVPSQRRSSGLSNMQVRIIKPSTFDQAKQITDTLLSHRTVLLNLEGLDVNTAQRIVDFASGSCYALHGNFMKISHFIIVITPEDVDIAGDITSENETASVLGAFGGMAGAQQDMGGMAGSPFAQNSFLQ